MSDRKELICAFTGHRHIDEIHKSTLTEALGEQLEALITEGYTHFRAGGAIGFDTIAALKVLEKRNIYPHIKLHLFLPCHGQDARWPDSSRSIYEFLLSQTDTVHYTSDIYTLGCMQQRNREMIDGCDICVAYYIEQRTEDTEGQLSIFGEPTEPRGKQKLKGGTKYTVKYAKKNGIRVINMYCKI